MSSRFPDDLDPQDPLAARLRDALSAEAAMVAPSDDGLQQIRDGIGSSSRRPWWRHPAAPAAAAAVVLALMAGGIALLADHGTSTGPVVTGGPSTTAPVSTAPESPAPSSPTHTTSSTPSPGGTMGFVYYMHAEGSDVRLYREQHVLPSGPGGRSALQAMFDQPPQDPDYVSVWPKGTKVLSYSVSGGVASVDLSDAPAGCACVQLQAMQQLVYTVTANDQQVQKVLIRVNGRVPGSDRNDWSKPVARAPMLDVQGLVWLLTPEQDATVSSPVRISGYGTAFEGTISWQVLKDGAEVAQGHTQGGSNGTFGTFADSVTLDPGSYEIRAFESSAKDGSAIHVDTKSFTVR